MFNRILMGLCISLAVALALLGYSTLSTRAENAALSRDNTYLRMQVTAANTLRQKDREAMQRRIAVAEAALKRKEADAKILQEALAANPDWAGQRVPDGVAGAVWVR